MVGTRVLAGRRVSCAGALLRIWTLPTWREQGEPDALVLASGLSRTASERVYTTPDFPAMYLRPLLYQSKTR